MSFGLVVRSFSGRFFRPRNAPLFASQKRQEKSSPCLSLFFGVLFLLRGGFWKILGKFGARAPLLLLELFLVGSGCAFCMVFLYKTQGVLFGVFWFQCFFGPSLSPSLSAFSPCFSSGGRPGLLSSSFFLPACRTPDSRYLRRRERMAAHVLFFLLLSAGSAAVPLFLRLCPLSPALSLSSFFLSLFLACKHFTIRCFNEEFLASVWHQPVLFTSLPFVHFL